MADKESAVEKDQKRLEKLGELFGKISKTKRDVSSLNEGGSGGSQGGPGSRTQGEDGIER